MVQRREIKRFIPFVKVCVSAGLIVLLFKIIDVKKLKLTLFTIEPIYLVLSACIMFLIIVLASWRWRICLLPQDIDISIGNSLSYSLIGFFFNNFTPSTVGGDVAKGVIVSRFSKKKLPTITSILMDRLTGFLATGIMALFSLIISFNLPLPWIIRAVIFLFVCLVTGLLFLILHKRVSRRIVSFFYARRLQNLAEKLGSVSNAFSRYLTYPGFIKNTVSISLLMQAANIFVSYLIARGLGIELSFLYFLIFIPLIMAVMSIPISFNGLGLREGAYVVFFNLAGISSEKSMALSIAYYMVILIISLIGGVIFLWSLFGKKAAQKMEGKND